MIHLVSHCWEYSRALTYQISSLVLYPPQVDTTLTVFYAEEDQATTRRLAWFLDAIFGRSGRLMSITLDLRPMRKSHLFARAIGRNQVAQKAGDNDVVWFTDADYFFGLGCIDAVAKLDFGDYRMLFPRLIWFNKTRENGDEYAARAADPAILDIRPGDFKHHRLKVAIGGVQIVPGRIAREFGYCPTSRRWQRPVGGDQFPHNNSDVGFRKLLNPKGRKVEYIGQTDLPEVFRIRQSAFGVVDNFDATAVQAARTPAYP